MHYLEMVERARNGKKIEKETWDYNYVILTVMELVEEYHLKWDPTNITPWDDDLMNRFFDAALEFIARTGVYAIEFKTIIPLTKEEILEAVKNMPQTLVMGEGKEAVTLFSRKPEDVRRPLVWAGNPGCPTPESLFLPSVMSWMKEPVVDLATCGSLIDVDGYKVYTGEPSEVLAVRRELELLREGLRRVDRPGMGLLAAESSVSEVGDLCAIRPDLLRQTDSHLVAMFNELIIDRNNMLRAINNSGYGMRNAGLTCTMMGGHGGDAPGSALLMLASMLASSIVARTDYQLCHPIHINHIATSTRACMWIESIACQTLALRAPQIVVCDIYPKSGAMTKELLYEVAANAIAITVSGGHLEGVGSADGNAPNGTGLEARLMGEVGRAVTKQRLTRQKGNEIIQKLLGKYEYVFKYEKGNPGVCITEAYDMTTITPKPAWLAMYDEVVHDLAGLGLDIEKSNSY